MSAASLGSSWWIEGVGNHLGQQVTTVSRPAGNVFIDEQAVAGPMWTYPGQPNRLDASV